MIQRFLFLSLLIPALSAFSQHPSYPWLDSYQESDAIQHRIPVPNGFERPPAEAHSFTDWLRHLPLKLGRPKVLLYNGQEKGNQQAHHAVIRMDVGKRDLQQCADAVMRLRAEYLLACGKISDIHFNFTSGDVAAYEKYKAGYRAQIQGNQVRWVLTAKPSDSYASFKSYMNLVFSYAGTHSLSKELQPVANPQDIQAGDVFIWGGFPGHAVIVLDVAVHPTSGKKLFLLAQSYMPAQEMHVLRNPNNPALSPWYEIPKGTLFTPEWSFDPGSLKRFSETE